MTLHELWEDLVPPERRWLGLIIFASLCAHTAFFFIFRIIPPAAQGLPLKPAQITLLSSEIPNIVWLDWRDPSAIALPRTPLPQLRFPAHSPELPDRYAGLAALSGQVPVGKLVDDRRSLQERSPQDFFSETLHPSLVGVETPPQPGGTELQFLGDLTGREPVFRKEFPQPPVSDVLRVTVLNVGISASGLVEAIMVEETSLDASVDQMAIATLRQWKFKPRLVKVPGREIDWGKVIVYWDYQSKPRPAAPALP
jgi:hypothetical protein